MGNPVTTSRLPKKVLIFLRRMLRRIHGKRGGAKQSKDNSSHWRQKTGGSDYDSSDDDVHDHGHNVGRKKMLHQATRSPTPVDPRTA